MREEPDPWIVIKIVPSYRDRKSPAWSILYLDNDDRLQIERFDSVLSLLWFMFTTRDNISKTHPIDITYMRK